MAEDTTPRTVTAQVVRAIVDRTKWKSYVPEVWFDKLFVTFHVPPAEIVQDEVTGTSIITLEGFAVYVLDPLASAVEEMHNRWLEAEAKKMEDLNTKPQIKPKGEQK